MVKKKVGAYITVEASFIVPMIVVIIVLVIYMTFYEYNKCVVYQDCYIAALRGSQMREMTEAEIKSKVTKYAYDLLDNQVFQYAREPKADVSMLNVKVSASTKIDLHIPQILTTQKDLSSSGEASSSRLNPVVLIRAKY